MLNLPQAANPRWRVLASVIGFTLATGLVFELSACADPDDWSLAIDPATTEPAMPEVAVDASSPEFPDLLKALAFMSSDESSAGVPDASADDAALARVDARENATRISTQQPESPSADESGSGSNAVAATVPEQSPLQYGADAGSPYVDQPAIEPYRY